MTFFFNLDNLEKESCNNPKDFIRILKTVYYKKLPNNKDIKPVKLNIHGKSFILNLDRLFKETKHIDILYVVQYIKLCARRDYTMYKLYGIKYLELSYYPDINLDIIKTNPLLNITNKEIHFKLE